MKIYYLCEFCDKVFRVEVLDDGEEKIGQLSGVCPECGGELAWQHNALIYKGYEH